MIPKAPKFEADMVKMRPFFPDGMTAEWIDPPKSLVAGEKAKVRFAITNANAGHLLPTGDPERFLLVKVEAKDESGISIGAREEYIGAKYQWNPVKKLSDTRLAPKERREYELEFAVPKSGKVRLTLDASKHRINQENFDYHQLEGRYVAGIPFLALSLELPIE